MTKLKLLVIIFSLGYSSYMGTILFSAFYEIHTDNQQKVQKLFKQN